MWIARKGDRTLFLRLLEDYLEETHHQFDDMPKNDRNLAAFGVLFSDLMQGKTKGALAIDHHGFSLGVGLEGPFDYGYGRMAVGMGTFVEMGHRRSGLATELRKLMIEELKRQGFEALMGTVHSSNEAAIESLKEFGMDLNWRLGYLSLEGD